MKLDNFDSDLKDLTTFCWENRLYLSFLFLKTIGFSAEFEETIQKMLIRVNEVQVEDERKVNNLNQESTRNEKLELGETDKQEKNENTEIENEYNSGDDKETNDLGTVKKDVITLGGNVQIGLKDGEKITDQSKVKTLEKNQINEQQKSTAKIPQKQLKSFFLLFNRKLFFIVSETEHV